MLRVPTFTAYRRFCQPFRTSHIRAMSSEEQLHRFVIYAPDYADEGALERRLKVRAQHMVGANKLTKEGVLQIGGGLMTPDGLTANNPATKIIGSMMVIRAKSLEEARKIMESDIYWTGNIWDKERTVILPFLQAMFDT